MTAKILVLDDDIHVLRSVERICKRHSYDVRGFTSHLEAEEALHNWRPDVALIDVVMPVSGLDLLRQWKQTSIDAEFIVMTGHASIDTAVEALREGAFDFVGKPFEHPDCLVVKIERALERAHLSRRARLVPEDLDGDSSIIGQSGKIARVKQLIRKVGPSDGTVLITGETGSGKELVARSLHSSSRRANQPFLAINCAAFTEGLIESEIFGHEKGSFTGATMRREGLFVEANKGTLFLDEIGEMPLSLQAKLLRVLQEGEVRRVGGNVSTKVDVRVVAATNRNLLDEIKAGRFREDLYYRLNVIHIEVPSLRERKEDIAILAAHFLKRFQADSPVTKRLAPKTLELMERYSWPGNIRELVNIMQRAIILSEDTEILPRALPEHLLNVIDVRGEAVPMRLDMEYQPAKQLFLEAFDKHYLGALLEESSGSLAKAAALAGMDRSNFRKLVLKAGLNNPENSAEEEIQPTGGTHPV